MREAGPSWASGVVGIFGVPLHRRLDRAPCPSQWTDPRGPMRRARWSALVMLVLLGGTTIGCLEGPVGGYDPKPNPEPQDQSCNTTSECTGGKICNPSTNKCVSKLGCTSHEACGRAAFCDGLESAKGSCKVSLTTSPCANDDNCSLNQQCVGGHCGCNGDVYQAQNVAPNLLVVLDRSGSMKERLVSGNPQTKWQVAKAAITKLVNDYGSKVRMGLKLYPGANPTCSEPRGIFSCHGGYTTVDTPVTDIDNASSIIASIDSAGLCDIGTPTAEALDPLPEYAPLEDASRANYVMLVTDGESTCSDPGPKVTDLLNQSPTIKTFVVGFGGGVDVSNLNDLAMRGGTARASKPYYYQADTASSLEEAFASIASGLVSCSYTLSTTPPDASRLYVYIGNDPVPRDTGHAMGWDYDASSKQVTFYGATCESIKKEQTTHLSFIYGCSTIVR